MWLRCTGEVSFAVVRKLALPLSTAEKQRVRDFANRNVGRRMNERANVFMADPNDSRLQRFNCLQHIDWLAAAAQAGQFVPSAAQRALIQRRCRAQRLVQWAFQATQPLRPLLLRPPLKIVGRWVLKAADAWSRPAAGAPTGENAGPPAPPSSAESASSLNPSHPTPC